MADAPPVPANIAPLVDVLGVDGTVRFLLFLGGAELHIARHPRPRSRLVQVVGAEKAQQLADVSHLLPTRIPVAKPWLAATLHAKGLPVAEIARTLHVSDVSVRSMLRRAEADTRQLPLF